MISTILPEVNYLSFKKDFCFEKYLINLKRDKRVYISKLRCSNIKFPVEVGRWSNIPRENRICNLFASGSVGNEYHYLLICCNEEIKRLRNIYIPKYYFKYPTEEKFYGLLYFGNITVLNNTAIFVKKILKYF